MNKEISDTTLVEVNIPFMGFYGTCAEEAIQLYTEADAYDASPAIVERINEFNMVAEPWACIAAVVRVYTDEFFHSLNELVKPLGMPEVTYVPPPELESPREYNFKTDRIFVKIPLVTLLALWNIMRNDSTLRKVLDHCIQARFTSYEGFISFYDNSLAMWETKNPEEFDCNEFGTILYALKDYLFDEDWEYVVIAECCQECRYQVSWGEAADTIANDIAALQQAADAPPAPPPELPLFTAVGIRI